MLTDFDLVANLEFIVDSRTLLTIYGMPHLLGIHDCYFRGFHFDGTMKSLVIVVIHYIIYFVQVMIRAGCGKQSPHHLFQGAVEPFYNFTFGFVIGDNMMNVMLF